MTDIKQILQNIGYQNLKDFGGWFRTKPLYRSSSNSTVLAINKNTGYWYDYKLCRGGKFSELVQISLNLSTLTEADKLLAEKYQFNHVVLQKEKASNDYAKTYDASILKALINDQSYWVKRGLPEEIVAEFSGGVATKGSMVNRYVFPIFSTLNKIIGFSGRTLKPVLTKDSIKWKHLGPKKDWVYPSHLNKGLIQESKTVFLVESIGDMLSLWSNGYKNVLVTFGLSISPKIIKFLLENAVERVVVAFNNDSGKNFAGNDASKKARAKLLTFFDDSQVIIKLPCKKDFGEMSKIDIDLYMKEFHA